MKISGLILIFFTGYLFLQQQEWELIVDDPLTSAKVQLGELEKISVEGNFSSQGWQSVGNKGMLKIRLTEDAGCKGKLQVNISNCNWIEANRSAGKDKKIHLLSMFSNSNGDHHFEDGSTSEDALWTLRAGADENGDPRYGPVFKLLWSARGAKRAPGNQYHEVRNRKISWHWDPKETYRVAVEWSNKRESIKVWVNDQLFYDEPWAGQVSPLCYIFIGKAGDFASWQGPVFSDLKIYKLK